MKHTPRMNRNSPPGTKVIFDNEGGYESDRKHALDAGLIIGATYTVASTDVRGSSTSVHLREFPRRFFNSVQFALHQERDETGLTITDKVELVRASITRIKDAERWHKEAQADPSSDSDDRGAAKARFENAEREFGLQWKNVEAILKEGLER